MYIYVHRFLLMLTDSRVASWEGMAVNLTTYLSSLYLPTCYTQVVKPSASLKTSCVTVGLHINKTLSHSNSPTQWMFLEWDLCDATICILFTPWPFFFSSLGRNSYQQILLPWFKHKNNVNTLSSTRLSLNLKSKPSTGKYNKYSTLWTL